MAHERKCILCGTKYQYCPKCPSYSHLPTWMISFDKKDCRDIFKSVCDYNFGKISAPEAKAVLDEYPDMNYSHFSAITQNAIAKILEETKPKKGRKRNITSKENNINETIEVIDKL